MNSNRCLHNNSPRWCAVHIAGINGQVANILKITIRWMCFSAVVQPFWEKKKTKATYRNCLLYFFQAMSWDWGRAAASPWRWILLSFWFGSVSVIISPVKQSAWLCKVTLGEKDVLCAASGFQIRKGGSHVLTICEIFLLFWRKRIASRYQITVSLTGFQFILITLCGEWNRQVQYWDK